MITAHHQPLFSHPSHHSFCVFCCNSIKGCPTSPPHQSPVHSAPERWLTSAPRMKLHCSAQLPALPWHSISLIISPISSMGLTRSLCTLAPTTSPTSLPAILLAPSTPATLAFLQLSGCLSMLPTQGCPGYSFFSLVTLSS